MNIIFDKKMKNYKEIKGFSRNEYIRIAYMLPKWNDIGVAYMKGLAEMAPLKIYGGMENGKKNIKK